MADFANYTPGEYAKEHIRITPTTLADGVSLDIWNSASNPYTLKIMTWTALVITPLVIAYQAWTYWVFRKRLMAERKVSQ